MGKKLYVGNLNFRTTDDSLADAFASRGFPVVSAKIIVDRETGRSRGFAFVEFATDEQGSAALGAMHDHDVEGRQLKVTEARAKTDGPAGGFRGGFDAERQRGGFEGERPRSSYEGERPRSGPHESSSPDGGRGGYGGAPRPTGGFGGGQRSDDRGPREGDGNRGGFRSQERGPRLGGFAGPPAAGATPFGAEEPAASRRGRGERRDLRKQHERRDEVFDDDEDY